MINPDKLNFSSFYKHFANNELLWLPSDDPTRYEINLKTRPQHLKKYGWLDRKITYKFNSLGFRCDEFSHQPTVMFLGCSNTVGIGLPLEDLWAEIVAKELNLKCANLGIGGSSSDTAFRLCLGYIDKIKPQIVIYNQPPVPRIELMLPNKIDNIMLADALQKNPKYFNYLSDYMIDETNIDMNMKKNLLAIKFLCHERNIKFVYFDNYMNDFSPLAKQDFARDLMHYGTVHNAEFAKHVLSNI